MVNCTMCGVEGVFLGSWHSLRVRVERVGAGGGKGGDSIREVFFRLSYLIGFHFYGMIRFDQLVLGMRISQEDFFFGIHVKSL